MLYHLLFIYSIFGKGAQQSFPTTPFTLTLS